MRASLAALLREGAFGAWGTNTRTSHFRQTGAPFANGVEAGKETDDDRVVGLNHAPRCHGTDLAEQRDDCRRTLRCMQCGYVLLLDEIRFLIEDVLDKVPDQERTAA